MASPPLAAILRKLRTFSQRQYVARGDAELIARFVEERDESAFEVLVWRHGGLVYRLARRLLGRESDVEDAFQATFLILARDAGRIGRRESLAGWLYRVAYRVALRVRRLRPSAELLPDDLIGADTEPSVQLAERESQKLLLDEIARLPECYRLTVVLCCLEGKSNVQAARELGCPCGTVDSRLAWARRRLRDRLIRRGLAPAVAGPLSLGLAWDAQAVPSALTGSTASLAVVFASQGEAALGVTASARILNLVHGVTPMVSLSKFKLLAACVVIAGLIGFGGSSQNEIRLRAEEPPSPQPAQSNRPAESGWRLKATWKVGDAPVLCLAYSPDGKAIVVSSGLAPDKDGELTFRDAESGKILWLWTISPAVKSVAFSPDGKRLATVEGRGLAVIRDVPSGKQLAKVEGDIEVIGFSPSGAVAMGTHGGRLIVTNDFRLPEGFGDDRDPVRAFAFSPDGRRVAFSRGSDLRIQEMDDGKTIWAFAEKQPLGELAYSPDGKLVAVAVRDQVYFLDAATGKIVRTFKTTTSGKPALAYSPDGQLLAVAFADDAKSAQPTADRHIHLFDVATGRLVAKLPSQQRILRLAFSPDGKSLASGDDGGNVKLWSKAETPAEKTAVESDRLDKLVEQLARRGRTNEQCVEAIFLATLGRFPAETELTLTTGHLAKATDRKEALQNIMWAILNSKEFGTQVESLQKRLAETRPK